MTTDDEGSAVDAGSELERLNALPLEERAGALAETVRRLEAELDATEATRATRTGPAGN
jgi:uncharacterized small protein (DUF1192 family)